jgi:hypothetical protein
MARKRVGSKQKMKIVTKQNMPSKTRMDMVGATRPTLIMVGADKGGVGKSTLSRLLLDYFERRELQCRAFDTEHPRGTLNRFYSQITDIIDLEAVADQMKVLDTMDDAAQRVTVVDLKAGVLSSVLETFERIGVIDAARNGQYDLGLFHVVGPSVASLEEMAEIAKYTHGIQYIVARNFINETSFFEWDDSTYKKYFSDLQNAQEMDIPKLNEMAYEAVDLAGATFSNFVDNRTAAGDPAGFSFVLRGYVKKWRTDVDSKLEKLALIQGLDKSAPRSLDVGRLGS